MEFVSVENVDVIMRQTNYTKEEAETKLSQHNNDVVLVVKEYLDIEDKKENNEDTKELPNNLQNIKNMRNILKQTKPIQPTLTNSN
jgi:hypothetical protein